MLDRMYILVISDHRAGPIIYEVDVADMTRARVLEDIRQGQYGRVLRIIEFNPVEGICREVTDDEDFARALERDDR